MVSFTIFSVWSDVHRRISMPFKFAQHGEIVFFAGAFELRQVFDHADPTMAVPVRATSLTMGRHLSDAKWVAVGP
jgi:hypothetical protein